jgi:hypothetical protein
MAAMPATLKHLLYECINSVPTGSPVQLVLFELTHYAKEQVCKHAQTNSDRARCATVQIDFCCPYVQVIAWHMI